MRIQTFDELTSNLRRRLTYAVKQEEELQQKILQAADKANTLSWHGQELMMVSHLRRWLEEIARWHQAAIINHLQADDLKDPSLPKDLDGYALHIVKRVASHCMEGIYDGPSSSSNGMTVLESVAKIDALKKVLEAFVGYGRTLVDFEFMSRAIDADQVHQAEREAFRLKQVHRVTYRAASTTTFVVEARNHKNDVLERLAELKTRAKGPAKEAAEDYAKLFAEQQGFTVYTAEEK